MHLRWLLPLVVFVMPTATAHAVATDCVNVITFASEAEKNWVEAVHDHTDMTCLQTRNVYRNLPGQRDEFPGNHVWTSTAQRVPSPAIAGSLAATEWCKITTTEKYRAPILPFGDHVLFSFTMSQTFSYN